MSKYINSCVSRLYLRNYVTCKNHHIQGIVNLALKNKKEMTLFNLSKSPTNNGIDGSVCYVGRHYKDLFMLHVRFAILLPRKNQSEQLTEPFIKFWCLP